MNYSIRALLFVFVICLSSPGFGGGGAGSIPLHSGGSGSIPLRLQGEALLLQHDQNGDLTDASIRKVTRILATVAEEGQNPEDMVLACRLAGTTKVAKAEGTLVLGNDTFLLQGVCFNEDTNMMEFVSATAQGEEINRANVVGRIPESGVMDRFDGRVTVDSSTSRQRFIINTESTPEAPQNEDSATETERTTTE